jgi:hypothetical protein
MPKLFWITAVTQYHPSSGARRQAGASGQGEVHLFARCARGNLQRFVGNIEGEQGVFGLVKSQGCLTYGSRPFVWECQCFGHNLDFAGLVPRLVRSDNRAELGKLLVSGY